MPISPILYRACSFESCQYQFKFKIMDNELIKRAWSISCHNWEAIDELIEMAGSDEVKEQLRSIQKHKYHREEQLAGMG